MPKLRRLGATKTPFAEENTTLPSTAISPKRGRSNPAIERNVVVLPQPLGPRSVNSSPSGTSNDTSCAALTTWPLAAAYSVCSDLTLSTLVSLYASATPNRRPMICASTTKPSSTIIIITPSADSSTYWPFCHSSQIVIETTSVPGLYSRIELANSRIETTTM